MKARVRTKVYIEAAPTEVFRYLAHTEYHELWNPNLRRIVPIEELSKGAKYTSYSTVMGVRIKAQNIVSKFINNTEIEIRNKTGMLDYCVSYKLQPNAEGTELTCTLVVSTENKAFAFAKPMLEQLTRRELRVDLMMLKAAVEQNLGKSLRS